MLAQPPSSTLFPYTTLFRSRGRRRRHASPRCRRSEWWVGVSGSPCRRRRAPSSNGCLRSEEHTSELQSHSDLVCRLLLEKKNGAGLGAAALGETLLEGRGHS